MFQLTVRFKGGKMKYTASLSTVDGAIYAKVGRLEFVLVPAMVRKLLGGEVLTLARANQLTYLMEVK